jgi:hypothetical protein
MQLLQDDMDSLLQWKQDWQMEFHPSKCQLLHITKKRKPFARDYDIRGHKLEEVESAKYLGGYHPKESQLEYPHRRNHKKANSTRAFIQRNLNHCPQRDEIHLLFNACKTVASICLYGIGPRHRSEHTKTRSSAKKICPLRDEQLPSNQ